MGFAAAAAYFERRAKMEHDPDARLQLKEVASLYWKLAGITPDFPPGCDGSKSSPGVTRWQQWAEECRTIGEHLTDPKCRAQMLALADTYQRLSQAAE